MPRRISEELTRKKMIELPTLQEEFAGVVSRAVVEPSRDIEGLPPDGDLRRGRMSEAGRQVAGLFESLLSQSFSN